MSSAPSPDLSGRPRRRAARHRARELIFAVPRWAPGVVIVLVTAALGGVLWIGYEWGYEAGANARGFELEPNGGAGGPGLETRPPPRDGDPHDPPSSDFGGARGATATTATTTASSAEATPPATGSDPETEAPVAPPVGPGGPGGPGGPPSGAWGVQVGAFPTQSEADARRADLAWSDLSSYVLPVDLPGRGRWYRVRLGAFPQRSDAVEAARRIQRRTGRRPLVVQYP